MRVQRKIMALDDTAIIVALAVVAAVAIDSLCKPNFAHAKTHPKTRPETLQNLAEMDPMLSESQVLLPVTACEKRAVNRRQSTPKMSCAFWT